MHKVVKIALILLASLLGVVLLAFGAGTLWLRSSRGHQFIATQMNLFITQHIHGQFYIASTDGPVLGRLILNDAWLKDASGHEVASVKKTTLDFKVIGALFGRLRISHLTIEDGHADIEAFTDNRLDLQPLFALIQEKAKNVAIEDITLQGFAFNYHKETLHQAAVHAFLWLDDKGRVGVFDMRDFHAVYAVHGDKPWLPLELAGRMSWDRETQMDLRDVLVTFHDSELGGSLHMTDKRIDAELPRLRVTGADFHRAIAAEEPPAMIVGKGSAHGPRAAIVTKLVLHPGKGTVDIDSIANLSAQKIRGSINVEQLDGRFFPSRPPFTANAHLKTELAFTHGVKGPVELKDGNGIVKEIVLDKVAVNAEFTGNGIDFARVAADVPGASASVHGTIDWQGNIDLHALANITELGKFLGTTKGHFELPSPPKDRSIASVEVSVEKKAGHDVKTKIGKIGLLSKIKREPDGTAK